MGNESTESNDQLTTETDLMDYHTTLPSAPAEGRSNIFTSSNLSLIVNKLTASLERKSLSSVSSYEFLNMLSPTLTFQTIRWTRLRINLKKKKTHNAH